jgi:hypothetical protein
MFRDDFWIIVGEIEVIYHQPDGFRAILGYGFVVKAGRLELNDPGVSSYPWISLMSIAFRHEIYLPSATLASFLEEFRLRTDNTFVHFGLKRTTCDGQVSVRTTQPEARQGQQKRPASPEDTRRICSHSPQ